MAFRLVAGPGQVGGPEGERREILEGGLLRAPVREIGNRDGPALDSVGRPALLQMQQPI